jgi:hypothetical protein
MPPMLLLAISDWWQPGEWTHTDWIDLIQAIGAIGTLGALVFTALELRQSARERARLTRRLAHERLEDLAIAVARAEQSIQVWQSIPAIQRDLAELRARLTGLNTSEHPETWLLAGANPTVVPRPQLEAVAARARDETFEHLRVSSLALPSC